MNSSFGPLAFVATLAAVLGLTSYSSDSQPFRGEDAKAVIRRSDCSKIIQAIQDRKRSRPSVPPSEFVNSAGEIVIPAFRQVLPNLKDPELATAIKTMIELDRQMKALKDGGSSEARGVLNNQFYNAGKVFDKACPKPRPHRT